MTDEPLRWQSKDGSTFSADKPGPSEAMRGRGSVLTLKQFNEALDDYLEKFSFTCRECKERVPPVWHCYGGLCPACYFKAAAENPGFAGEANGKS